LSAIFFVIALLSIETAALMVACRLLERNGLPGNRVTMRKVFMGAEETRHDLWLKRINTWIAILGGSVASVAGTYNFLPSFFPAAPGHIAAIVREQGGAPVPRAHVELLSSENVLLGTSETDRAGRYIKKDLRAGSYTLKVSRAAFEPQVAKVSVASKETTDLEMVLKSRSRAQTVMSSKAANTSPVQGSAIRSALEETGAAWIKTLSKPGP
jgi:Carboxypeptidase regulatory-like domain